jgi:hypothetical protein
MAIVPPADFYTGAPTNIDGISIYSSVRPVVIDGGGIIKLKNSNGQVVKQITTIIPGTVNPTLTVPTTAAVIAFGGGGGFIPVPLNLVGVYPQFSVSDGTSVSSFGDSNVANYLRINTNNDILQLESNNHVYIPMTENATSFSTGALQCDGGACFDGTVVSKACLISDASNPVLTFQKGPVNVPIGLNASNEIYFQDRLLIEDADPQLILKNTSGDLGNLRVVTDGSSRFLTVNPAFGIYNGTDSIRFQIDGSSVVQVSQIGISHFNWRGVPHVFESYVRTPELRLKNTAVGTAAIIEQNASGEVESDSTLYVNTGDPVIKLRDASTGEEAEMHVGGASTSLGISCVMAQSGLGIQSSGGGPKTFFQFNGDVMEVSHRTGVTD